MKAQCATIARLPHHQVTSMTPGRVLIAFFSRIGFMHHSSSSCALLDVLRLLLVLWSELKHIKLLKKFTKSLTTSNNAYFLKTFRKETKNSVSIREREKRVSFRMHQKMTGCGCKECECPLRK